MIHNKLENEVFGEKNSRGPNNALVSRTPKSLRRHWCPYTTIHIHLILYFPFYFVVIVIVSSYIGIYNEGGEKLYVISLLYELTL